MTSTSEIWVGDTSSLVSNLQQDSICLTVTSPPYFRHRDYGHTDQLGQEDSVEEYVERLADIFSAILVATTKTGSCFVVIGDSYEKGSLQLIPHRLAIAFASKGWNIRNDLIWRKMDPPPESVRTRWRSSHEHVIFMTKRRTGYKFFDDEIRKPYEESTLRRWGNAQEYGGNKSANRKNANDSRMRHGKTFKLNPKGCIPQDVIDAPTGGSSELHFATFSPKLINPLIRVASSQNDLVLSLIHI